MNKAKFERQSRLTDHESAVKRIVGKSHEAQDKAEGKDGRGRPGNAGEVGRDKDGVSKATYALPIDRQKLVRDMATSEDVSQTDIIEAAIVALYNAWKAERIDLSEYRVATKSLRFSWHLEIPDDFILF